MRGGRREGAGRKPGVPNKATREIKALAQQYGEKALMRLVSIMEDDDKDAKAQIAACKEILDRAYGKPTQVTDLTSSDGSMSPQGYAVIPEKAKDMKEWTQQIPKTPEL